MCASLYHLLSRQHAFQQVSRLISVACVSSLLLYLRMDLLAPLFGLWQDRPHQINTHSQTAIGFTIQSSFFYTEGISSAKYENAYYSELITA